MSKWFMHPTRRGQLISPFGVGNITFTSSGHSVIIAGADEFFRRDLSDLLEDGRGINKQEFEIEDWRLAKELGVENFRLPPDWRKDGEENKKLSIPVLRFPLYYKCNNRNCGYLFKKAFHDKEEVFCSKCESKGKTFTNNVSQVRFITICKRGHIQDFPWVEYVHSKPISLLPEKCLNNLFMEEKATSKLQGILIKCDSCGVQRRFDDSLFNFSFQDEEKESSWLYNNMFDDNSKYKCPGHMSWLGEKKKIAMRFQLLL